MPKLKNAGTRNPNARLHPDQVRAIRAMQGKASTYKVAAMYEIDPTHVHMIWTRKRWASLR